MTSTVYMVPLSSLQLPGHVLLCSAPTHTRRELSTWYHSPLYNCQAMSYSAVLPLTPEGNCLHSTTLLSTTARPCLTLQCSHSHQKGTVYMVPLSSLQLPDHVLLCSAPTHTRRELSTWYHSPLYNCQAMSYSAVLPLTPEGNCLHGTTLLSTTARPCLTLQCSHSHQKGTVYMVPLSSLQLPRHILLCSAPTHTRRELSTWYHSPLYNCQTMSYSAVLPLTPEGNCLHGTTLLSTTARPCLTLQRSHSHQKGTVYMVPLSSLQLPGHVLLCSAPTHTRRELSTWYHSPLYNCQTMSYSAVLPLTPEGNCLHGTTLLSTTARPCLTLQCSHSHQKGTVYMVPLSSLQLSGHVLLGSAPTHTRRELSTWYHSPLYNCQAMSYSAVLPLTPEGNCLHGTTLLSTTARPYLTLQCSHSHQKGTVYMVPLSSLQLPDHVVLCSASTHTRRELSTWYHSPLYNCQAMSYSAALPLTPERNCLHGTTLLSTTVRPCLTLQCSHSHQKGTVYMVPLSSLQLSGHVLLCSAPTHTRKELSTWYHSPLYNCQAMS